MSSHSFSGTLPFRILLFHYFIFNTYIRRYCFRGRRHNFSLFCIQIKKTATKIERTLIFTIKLCILKVLSTILEKIKEFTGLIYVIFVSHGEQRSTFPFDILCYFIAWIYFQHIIPSNIFEIKIRCLSKIKIFNFAFLSQMVH